MIPTIFDEIYSLIETNERSKIHFISIKKISIKSTRNQTVNQQHFN